MRGKLDAVGIADHVVVKGHAAHPGEAHAPRLQHATAAARPARRERGAGGAVEVAGDEDAGGRFEGYIFDGVASTEVMKAGYGQANTASEYGRNKVGEYKGVPSAKAL